MDLVSILKVIDETKEEYAIVTPKAFNAEMKENIEKQV